MSDAEAFSLVAETTPAPAGMAPWPDADLAWIDDDHRVYARGAAVTLTADALAALVQPARDALATVEERVDPSVAWAPPLRMYGGAAFDPSRTHDTDVVWEGFPKAAMVLPRECLIVGREGAALRVVRGSTLTPVPSPVDGRGEQQALHSGPWTTPRPASDSPPPLGGGGAVGGGRPAWTALVRDALSAFDAGLAQKIVGARRVDFTLPSPIDPLTALTRLNARAGEGTVRFLFARGGAAFVGATPETLVSKRGRTVYADALAGTLPRVGDDATTRDALLHGAKERAEHARVVEFVRETLSPWCEVTGPDVPDVKTLPSLHHLHTPLRGTLRDDVDALTLAAALHPTPAVAGTPRDVAMEWLRAHEPHPRGWYAGPFGWVDAHGDGRFVVTLRSGVLRGARAWAWVGAGLVPGSDPDKEWDETTAKLATFRVALGEP